VIRTKWPMRQGTSVERPEPLRDVGGEQRLFKRRSVLAAAGVLLAFGVLGGRLGTLQVSEHQRYVTLSQANRMRLLPVPPNRGLIHDRNGVVMAENRPTFELTLTPEQVTDLAATLRRLGSVVELDEATLASFHRLRQGSRGFHSIPLKTRLGEHEVAAFATRRHTFPGVEVEARLTRHYPLGSLAAHAIGHVGRIDGRETSVIDRRRYAGTNHIGKTGAELGFEDHLQGFAGLQRVETNALGRVIQTLERLDPAPGRDLRLSLDTRIQHTAEAALNGETGAVVALDIRTGHVLALASMPGFDPNLFVHGIDSASFSALRGDPERPLFNRTLNGRYPPGSTIKPFLALAALHYGVRTPQERIFCPGHFRLPRVRRPWRCWERRGHGHMDLKAAVAQSCDVYFYDLAHTLGIERMSAFLAQFGFGTRTGIDLPGESDGVLPSPDWKRGHLGESWFPGETVITGIGQGYFLTTPLQLAYATALLASRGRCPPPRLLLDETSEDPLTTAYPSTGQEPRLQLVRDDYWDLVTEQMIEVMHGARGTARAVGSTLDYVMAGKTGTAQVVRLPDGPAPDQADLERRLRDHALFNCFVPAREPRYAIAAIVEHGGGGASVAAPVARAVADACLMELPERRRPPRPPTQAAGATA
jgi:penicillin-binding protein 2